MLVKFFDTGKGSARHAFNYLLNDERVKAGTAKLFRGSPDSITFLTEQRMKDASYRGGALYTSGALSFSPEESKKLNGRMLGNIVTRFEETLFPSLDMSRFNIAWVLHTDKNRTELHFVIQNFDLETQKAFTPFVADRDLSRVNRFKNKVNADFKLSDPDLVKSHYYVKGIKRLSDEQKSFYRALNKEYTKYAEERNNPSFLNLAKGFLSKIRGQNEAYSHDLYSNEDKREFLQKFILERFKGVKINRASDKYASVDFNGSKMRLFFEKFEVKELDNDNSLKIEQNKEKGLFPIDYKPIYQELSNSYNLAMKQVRAEKERLQREKEEAEKERLHRIELEKQREIERKFRLLLNEPKDIFIKQVIRELECNKHCEEVLKPTFMGAQKIHDFILMFKEVYPNKALEEALNNTKSALRAEYGQQRYNELESKGFLNINMARAEIARLKDSTLNSLQNLYVDFYKKSDKFSDFKANVDDYKATRRNAINFDLRDYASDFLNQLLLKIERERLTLKDHQPQQQKDFNRGVEAQMKPNYPKMRM